MRILMRVAYDGTAYSGWQLQPNAATIEGELNKALFDLTGEEIQVTGASRTDAGVHSLGNVCVFDTDTRIPAEKICYALNTRLPEDIRVTQSREVDGDFHPRHTDSEKTYEYRIWNDRFPSPVLSRYSHFSYRRIDIEKMREAARLLVGEHDFGAFCSTGSQAETTVRTIYAVDVIEEYNKDYMVEEYNKDCMVEEYNKDYMLDVPEEADTEHADDKDGFGRMIKIRVTGSGFLYNMVRIIAGTLLDIGTGLLEVSDMEKALATHNREDAGPTAPACGLTMIGIRYK